MPSIVPPDTDKQAEDALTVLHEFAPPCDHHLHGGPSPAVWAVWYRNPRVCGCVGRSAVYTVCAPCWSRMTSKGQWLCPYCAGVFPSMANVLRVERL